MYSILIQYIQTLLGLLSMNPKKDTMSEALQNCAKAVRYIKKDLLAAKTIGEKQHLLSKLNQVKSLRQRIKLMNKHGGGLKKTETAKHRVHWDDSMSAFNSRIRTGIISNLKHKYPKDFLTDCKAIFKRRIQNTLRKETAIKVNMVFGGEFELVKAERINNEMKYFTTPNSPIYRDTNLDVWFNNNVVEPIMTKLEEFNEKESGWALKAVINLGVNINKFTPQLGSSYIELPKQIKQKEACINVKNNDNACFAWAVLSALYPLKHGAHADRTSSYPDYSSVHNLKSIQFPMTVRQIPCFEKQNNISINLYILKKIQKSFITLPTYLTKIKRDRHVNLLLIQDTYDTEAVVKYHYVWIKDLSRLLSQQLSQNHQKKHFCDRCLHYFHSPGQLDKHTEDCIKANEAAVKMPELGKHILKFKNYKNKEKVPFIVYADLESVLKSTNNEKKFCQHIPAVVGYFFKCSYDDSLSFYRSYRGTDCMKWFADEMEQLAQDVSTVFLCSYNIQMTATQEHQFRNATHCHICEKSFTTIDRKVRDHDHLIPDNNYRGAAHEDCNINYQDSHIIPVVFHNLSGYDAHFVISDMATRMKGSIDLLPITKEKYISFTKHIDDTRIQFRFIDSFRFMASSLDKLASYLNDFPILRSQFTHVPDVTFLTKKGVMPYDYINSFDRFNETSLPPLNYFYNQLESKPCPRRLYRRAVDVWNTFNCRTLGEYVDLYMKTDILLLADVFEQFRASCRETYSLDPAHYFTLPGFTWDAMLKHTEQELELLTDPNMFLFVERGIRGGLSQVCGKRLAYANNKYMPSYVTSRPDVFLMYYDINNQYGWAMSQYLPYGGFEWVDPNIDVTSMSDHTPEGYILEVDLEYPNHLHDLHKDLPFCPEHLNPKTMKPAKRKGELTKLIATLQPKKKYIIHYRALKQALQHGMIVAKIHRVLKFKQSPWLKSYIDLNTRLRKAAKNEFEKNLFKLMNNAVFGKTMENVRKRVNVKLVKDWYGRYGAESLISKPEFKSAVIFNDNLIAVELRKLQVHLNKPIYVGQAILDLAKTTIYSFHYDFMISRFGNNCRILYTDTDSLIYEIVEQDPYQIMKQECYNYFDTSDYPFNNIYSIPLVNKKVLGMMKDENNGQILIGYVGLKSKLYSSKILTTEDELENLRKKLTGEEYEIDEIETIVRNYGVSKKAKGVKKSVVDTKITFEDYIKCLETFDNMTTTQNLIRSDKHQVFSIKEEKVALSHEDDKRYHIPGSYETLPWGHYSLNESNTFINTDL